MVSLKSYNSFGVDVCAPQLIPIQFAEELLQLPKENRYRILGGGTNVLLTRDLQEAILHMEIMDCEILSENDESVSVQFGAGWIWHDVVKWALQRKLGGIENLSLIPGTIGAAPVQNIGAYGVELSQVLERVEGFYTSKGKFLSFHKEDCQLGYRDSIFKHELKDQFIITHVVLSLQKKPKLHLDYGAIREQLEKQNIKEPTIQQVSNAIINIRTEKLPDPSKLGNAGSFFKNISVNLHKFRQLQNEYPLIPAFPQVDGTVKIPTAWLIETCGWKGKRKGSVGCYDKQALVIVNYGAAEGREIWEFAQEIMQSVETAFGLSIQPEVNVW